MPKHLILCDCLGTQSLDKDAIETATGLSCSRVHTGLCVSQLEAASTAIAAGDALIACQQERSTFEEIAADLEVETPAFVDLRDRAGWSADTASKTPKMAAFLAEAMMEAPVTPAVDVTSEGMCLIVGKSDIALPAAATLSETLSVTVLLTDADAEPPLDRRYDPIKGHIRRVAGALGGFSLTIDALQQLNPGGRDLAWSDPRNGAASQCDIILDLTGDRPLFPAPEKREGYLRADPGRPEAVQAALLAASQLIGTFEKPLYVRLEASLCAHSRAGQTACSNCLDICPTGAITSAGDHVAIDPMICAGCGACSALCPSGAITYEDPPTNFTFRRMETLASAYLNAGGKAPRLLVHDAKFGAELIQLSARYAKGLPANVISMSLDTIAGFGHSEMLAALAVGFADVQILLAPTTERDALERELTLTLAITGKNNARLIDITDPEALWGALGDASAPLAEPILPMGTRRQVARTAAKALRPDADAPIPLPDTAPYGAVLVNTDACTLCLSCVSLCPSGALADNPDRPELRFQEDACLQCGLCATVCPEDAITYEARFDLSDAALSQSILHEEEPAACIECGALFGVKSTIDKITEKLAGKHTMFANPDAARMIQMCDNCRVQAQYHSENNPFAGGERPKPRTTDDYYTTRKDH
ncbi:MAG: 4Fe-4S binding protein [Pseudomonadota bacterium]